MVRSKSPPTTDRKHRTTIQMLPRQTVPGEAEWLIRTEQFVAQIKEKESDEPIGIRAQDLNHHMTGETSTSVEW